MHVSHSHRWGVRLIHKKDTKKKSTIVETPLEDEEDDVDHLYWYNLSIIYGICVGFDCVFIVGRRPNLSP